MSLIPEESYSFPDYFVRTVRCSKKPGEKILPSSAARPGPHSEPIPEPPAPGSEARREKVSPLPEAKPEERRTVSQSPPESPVPRAEAPRERKLIPAPPEAKLEKRPTVSQTPPQGTREMPRSVTPLPPMVKREPARTNIPAAVHLKRKVRYNTHLVAPEQGPADKKEVPLANPLNGVPQKRELPRSRDPVQPVKVNKVPNHAVQVSAPRPAATGIQPSSQRPAPPVAPVSIRAAADVSAAEQIEFELSDPGPFYPGKSRRKLVRFLVCEAIAIGALVLFAIFGLSRTFSGRAAGLYINIFTIAAAVAATLIPIFFYAIGPTLPRDDR